MARHQVLQHKLVSCTSAIPHPSCQRHPKDPTPCVTRNRTARRRCVPAPAVTAPARRFRARRCRTAAPADAPCQCTTHPRFQQLDHPPKHPHPSISSSTLPPSIGNTPQQRNNSNSSVDVSITFHPHDAGQLTDTPFGHAPSTRCVSFLTSTLMVFSTLTLLCLPSHKQEQS